MSDHPRVFISYCRSSQASWTLQFASRLRGDGVDVVIDDWDLVPGHDIHAFMERLVTDHTISRVLIICDREYQQRSDRRVKGVGAETQIIAPALYGQVTQTKFVPIVREFNGGRACLPAYLGSLAFLDCSTESHYESSYPRLVDFIYGIDVQKPPLGPSRPAPDFGLEVTSIGAGIGGLKFGENADADEVLRRAQKMLADDPSPQGYSLAGTLVAAAGLHRTAIEYLSHALRGDANQPTAWFNLGQAYEMLGHDEKASEALIHAMKLRRDFARELQERQLDLPAPVREFLEGLEARYAGLLRERAVRMEQVLQQLQSTGLREKDPLVQITSYEVERGANLCHFKIRLSHDGVASTFCYPEELRPPEIVLPFVVPEGVDFKKRKRAFVEHFGYREFEFNESADEAPSDMLFFCGVLKDQDLSANHLLRWIVRSVLFQGAGEAFLTGQPYWEVKVDDDATV